MIDAFDAHDFVNAWMPHLQGDLLGFESCRGEAFVLAAADVFEGVVGNGGDEVLGVGLLGVGVDGF